MTVYTRRDRDEEREVKIYYDAGLMETDSAWLLELEEGVEKWFPKSQCKIDKEKKTIIVPEWLAYKEGLI